MKKKRSVGTILFSIFAILFGAMMVTLMVALIIAFLTPQGQFSKNLLQNIKIEEMHDVFWAVNLHEIPICLAYIFLGTCTLVAGVGLVTLQDWGRKLFLLVVAYDVIETIANMIMLKHTLAPQIPWLIFDCVAFFYFTRPKVREQFRST